MRASSDAMSVRGALSTLAAAGATISLAVFATQPQPATAAFYTCDEIVSDLCPTLKTTPGVMQIKGLEVPYWIYEDPASADPNDLPLILVHGGPGFDSAYMEPIKQVACRGRRVIRYTQAGILPKPAENVAENHAHLLTIEYYLEELQALMDHLKIDKFHLLGNSWGTVVAQEFAVKDPPSKQLQGLILNGALSDPHYYIKVQRELLHSTLPPFTQRLLRKLEEEKAYDSELYHALNEFLTTQFTVRLNPMPECVERALANANFEVYVAMQGPSEFTISGVLGDWNVTGRLHRVTNPTLVLYGRYDTMQRPTEELIVENIKGAKLIELPHSGHLAMVDDADLFNDAVEEFLEDVESKMGHDEL